MRAKIRYTDEPLGELKIVRDFLPPPAALVFKEEGVKVTLALSRRSVEFFKGGGAEAQDAVPANDPAPPRRLRGTSLPTSDHALPTIPREDAPSCGKKDDIVTQIIRLPALLVARVVFAQAGLGAAQTATGIPTAITTPDRVQTRLATLEFKHGAPQRGNRREAL